MIFEVITNRPLRKDEFRAGKLFLRLDNWDDFTYKTLFSLIYIDSNAERHDIGPVKIARSGMGSGPARTELPESFNSLPDHFFSLGQEPEYYSNLMTLDQEDRRTILVGLRDVVFNHNAYAIALNENVTGRSLMRFVAKKTIEQQYRRILQGKSPLTEFRFAYNSPSLGSGKKPSLALDFHVHPQSRPPSNIHVLVGQNGAGKTSVLNAMSRCLAADTPAPDRDGRFSSIDEFDDEVEEVPFANLLSISFSAFDDFHELRQRHKEGSRIRHVIVGLQKRVKDDHDEWATQNRAPEELATSFAQSAKACSRDLKAERWKSALETLEADPLFSEEEVSSLLSVGSDQIARTAKRKYKGLSSGHKIVLLTITKLVENVEEKTLVLIDEPEAHLHPPLLSAFLRALSDLLNDRNGVAIVATHSPVVLQEVPRECVWKIVRHGAWSRAYRPDTETFAESVGILTREVFGLEVTRSGFHKMLLGAADSHVDIEDALASFDNEVGTEGRSLLASIWANKER